MMHERSLHGERRDRRLRRSETTELALGYQLQTCVERSGASTMVLADQDGLLVATSASGSERSEELAAILPVISFGSDFAGLMMNQMPGGDQVVVSSFTVADTSLYLCAVGNYSDEMHIEIARAKAGVRRILN